MDVKAPARVVVLTAGALGLARRVADLLPDAAVHGLRSRVPDAEFVFDDVGGHLRDLFSAGHPIIGLCAAGVLIRALAPLLVDKQVEPPVLAVAEDGSAVVPLLGGHHGANALARRIGEALGVAAAVTTAGDLRFGVALDAPPAGWRLANPHNLKRFVAALMPGATVRLDGDAEWLTDSRLPIDPKSPLTIRVTERVVSGSTADTLVYHPAVLAVGVGCERGADPEEVVALARRILAENSLAEASVAGIFSLDVKSDEPAVHAVADALGVRARFFDAARLEEERPRLLSPSPLVFREVGCHGVAEGAALAAAGPGGLLVVPKIRSARATCAVARAPRVIDVEAVGCPRGRLAVVGIGPGGADWRTAEAVAALSGATDLIGYRLYLDLLGPLARGKIRHAYDLGEEEARTRAALDLAAAGRSVALVCSGDPGIYAMASLVFELLEREDRPDWRRVALGVVPGISALQAAAARAGAPLGHDFCAISLSDLLTPWEVIERRVRVAAEGELVIAFYNPVSMQRTWQLAAAARILLEHRPADTPVVLARNLGRDGEALTVVRLDEFPERRIDMLTTVLVGSSATRRCPRPDGGVWVYTPRGYGNRRDGKEGEVA